MWSWKGFGKPPIRIPRQTSCAGGLISEGQPQLLPCARATPELVGLGVDDLVVIETDEPCSFAPRPGPEVQDVVRQLEAAVAS